MTLFFAAFGPSAPVSRQLCPFAHFTPVSANYVMPVKSAP